MSKRITSAVVVAALGAALGVACAPAAPTGIAWASPAAPGTCLDWIGQPVDRTCVPRLAKADAPLVLEIEERCGACGTTVERCSVVVEGRDITLSLDGKACEPAPGRSCSEACAKNRVKCSLPAMPIGRYTVHFGDTSPRVEVLELSTAPEATTRCLLDDAPNDPTSG